CIRLCGAYVFAVRAVIPTLVLSTDARANGCKPDGQRCATDISCCSRNCMKPTTPPGKARPMFGVCGTPTTTTTTSTTATTTTTMCTPTTCTAEGADCGSISDGCGGTLDCGTCPTDQACIADQCCAPAASLSHCQPQKSGDLL